MSKTTNRGRQIGDIAVEMAPEPEETRIEVLETEGLVKMRIGSQSTKATVFLPPDDAEELGRELIEEADAVGE